MANSTTLFILFLAISLALDLSNPGKWGAPMFELLSYDSATGSVDIGGMFKEMLSENIGILLISTAAAIVAGLLTSDASYGLFAGFITLMLGYSLAPIGFFVSSDIPFFIKAMVGIPLAFMYIFAWLGWYRGVEA